MLLSISLDMGSRGLTHLHSSQLRTSLIQQLMLMKGWAPWPDQVQKEQQAHQGNAGFNLNDPPAEDVKMMLCDIHWHFHSQKQGLLL